jgi:hypothetical protein
MIVSLGFSNTSSFTTETESLWLEPKVWLKVQLKLKVRLKVQLKLAGAKTVKLSIYVLCIMSIYMIHYDRPARKPQISNFPGCCCTRTPFLPIYMGVRGNKRAPPFLQIVPLVLRTERESGQSGSSVVRSDRLACLPVFFRCTNTPALKEASANGWTPARTNRRKNVNWSWSVSFYSPNGNTCQGLL